MNEESGQVITKLLAEHNLSQTEVAERLGVTQQAVQQWCSGMTSPRGKNLKAFCELFGIGASVALFGKTAAVNNNIPDAYLDDKYVRIGKISSVGVLQNELPPVESIRATDSWILSKCPDVNPKFLGLFTAMGNSMAPTINHLDIVIIDTSVKNIQQEGVYLLSYSGETYVKRVQKQLDGSLVLYSDDSKYPSLKVKKDELSMITVKGRCVMVLPVVTM